MLFMAVMYIQKIQKKVFCLLAYIMDLFKTSFIELALSPYARIILAIELTTPSPFLVSSLSTKEGGGS